MSDSPDLPGLFQQDGTTHLRPIITQYRYHTDASLQAGDGTPLGVGGRPRQLKAVINSEQIEYAAQQRLRAGSGDAGLAVLQQAANFLLLDDDDIAYGRFQSDPVTILDLASKVIGYETGTEGRVIEQYLQADCGCEGTSSGIRQAYTYDGDFENDGWSTVMITETGFDGTSYSTPYRSFIYDFAPRPGVTDDVPYLATTTLRDDTVPSGREWSTHFVYDSEGFVLEKWQPSAIASRTPGSGTFAPTLTTHGAGTGLVWVYEYDTNGMQVRRFAQEGVRSDGLGRHLIQEIEYRTDAGRFTLPTRVTRVRAESVSSLASVSADDREVIEYDYGFVAPGSRSPAWIRVRTEAELTNENGPAPSGTTYETVHLYDGKGRRAYTRYPDGSVVGRSYTTGSGGLAELVSNVSAANFSWTSPGASYDTTGWGSIDSDELVSSWTRNSRGLVTSSSAPGGRTMYYTREYREIEAASPSRPGIAYFRKIALPHKLAALGSYGANFDGPARVKYVSAGGQSIYAHRREVSSTPSYPPSGSNISGQLDSLLTGRRFFETVLSHGLSGRLNKIERFQGQGVAFDQVHETSFKYDEFGRLSESIGADGTINRIAARDVRGRPLEIEVGVEGEAFVSVASFYYDDPDTDSVYEQGVGDGNLSWRVYHASATQSRPYFSGFDFRNRLTHVLTPGGPHIKLEYDNLSRTIATEMHDASAKGSGAVFAPSASTRGSRREVSYGQRGLPYQMREAIDPSASSPSYLETDTWYDGLRRVIAVHSPAGAARKYEYDLHSRISRGFVTDKVGETHAAAASVISDRVLEQTEFAYASTTGLPTLSTHRMRLHDDSSGTGPLDASTSITTYTGYGYDDARRLVRHVAFGTNQSDFADGGIAPTWPPTGTLPSYSTSGYADTLIQAYDFDELGRLEQATDAEGRVTEYQYDDFYRTMVVIENRKDASVSYSAPDGRFVASNIAQSGSTGNDAVGTDRVTSYYYDDAGRVRRTVSHLGDSSGNETYQSTEYDYGVLTSSTLASLLNSNAPLSRIRFPDESDGRAVLGSASNVDDYSMTFAYNRLGQMIGSRDQNGTVHTYAFDSSGRPIENSVSVAAGVDDRIDRIVMEYDSLGRMYRASSMDDDLVSPVVNQYEFEFDGLWRVTDFHQNVQGPVRDSLGDLEPTTQTVGYVYQTAGGPSGESRLESLVYPDGSKLMSIYSIDPLGNSIDRARFRFFDGAGAGGIISDTKYLGAGTPVSTMLFDPGVTLDRTTNDAGERDAGTYYAFDRFGRLTSHVWSESSGYAEGTPGDGLPTIPPVVAQVQSFDRMSNPLTRFDARPGSQYSGLDHVFDYDGLDRLVGYTTGTDSDGNGVLAGAEIQPGQQVMELDHLGNPSVVKTDTNGDGSFTGFELENRGHDGANELGFTERSTGFVTWRTNYSYMKNGNLSVANSTNLQHQTEYTYDGWNRLVRAERVTPPQFPASEIRELLGEYEYAPFHQQTVRTFDRDPSATAPLERRRYYYALNWRLLEEHMDDSYDDTVSTPVTDRIGQYVYGAESLDNALIRRIDANTDGDYSDPGDGTWYLLNDVMGSVTAVLDRNGQLHERVSYTAHGVAKHSWAGDGDGDGDVDANDVSMLSSLQSSFPIAITSTDYNADFDFDRDGDLDSADLTHMNGLTYKAALGGRSLSDPNGPDNEFGYIGYRYRAETDLHLARHRHYSVTMMRWTSRDPLGYVDGYNLYQYVGGMPTVHTDPSGLIFGRPNQEHFDDSCGKMKGIMSERVANGELSSAEAACRSGQVCAEDGRSTLEAYFDGFVEGAVDEISNPHTALDIVGLVPLIGIPADLLNAALHASNGNYGQASLSLGASVPGLGYVANAGKAASGLGVAKAVAREMDIIKPGSGSLTKAGDNLNFNDAVEIASYGGDVFAASKDVAKRIADAAGDGKAMWHPPHGTRQYPHYHVVDGGKKQPGHVAY